MISFEAFADEFEKIARLTPAQKADAHHSADEKDWHSFEKNLNAMGFQKAVMGHPDSDAKLKKYVKNFGGYLKSRDVVAVMPSRTSSKIYKVKELASGRLACGCKDWQYYHSVRNSDCDHINDARASGMIKRAGVLWGARVLGKAKKEWDEGVEAKQLMKKLHPKPKKTWEDRVEDVSAIGHALL